MTAKYSTFACFFLTVLAMALPTTRAIAANDNGTLSVAEHRVRCWTGPHSLLLYGYIKSRPMGSYSPSVITGGEVLSEVYDQDNAGCKLVTGSTVSVSGFSADPGRTWLTSITCNGVTLNQSGAVRFFFAGGTATWEWSEQFGFQSRVGAAVNCTMSH